MMRRPSLSDDLRSTYDRWNNPPSPELPEGAEILLKAASEIESLIKELARVRDAHKAIMNEVLYGGTDLNDEPDIDRIHDFAKVGLRDMRQLEQAN